MLSKLEYRYIWRKQNAVVGLKSIFDNKLGKYADDYSLALKDLLIAYVFIWISG